jgi:UV DNA damage endonuclease
MTTTQPKYKLRLGLCCMNTQLRGQNPPIFASRTMRLNTYRQRGIKEIKKRAILNLVDLKRLIIWNNKHHISVFRLSSDIFPHMSNPKIESYSFDFALPMLNLIGNLANDYGQRLTFHPGQYNVLASPDEYTVDKTVNELNRHAEILDLMNQGPDGVIVIHGGGVYGERDKTIQRWIRNFDKLSPSCQKRLVIENCEKSWSVTDCLNISNLIFKQYGFYLPVVLDSHHYNCYSLIHPEIKQPEIEILLPDILMTWKARGITPKFHVSEQGSGKVGHHSDLISKIPEYMLQCRHQTNLDIMIEAKLKEQAVLKLQAQYIGIL